MKNIKRQYHMSKSFLYILLFTNLNLLGTNVRVTAQRLSQKRSPFPRWDLITEAHSVREHKQKEMSIDIFITPSGNTFLSIVGQKVALDI